MLINRMGSHKVPMISIYMGVGLKSEKQCNFREENYHYYYLVNI